MKMKINELYGCGKLDNIRLPGNAEINFGRGISLWDLGRRYVFISRLMHLVALFGEHRDLLQGR